MAWYLTQSGYTITMYFCLHQHYNQTFNCKTLIVIILCSNPLKIFFSSLLKALRGLGGIESDCQRAELVSSFKIKSESMACTF